MKPSPASKTAAPTYSYTRLDTFKQCPRQYAYRYIEKPDIEKQPTVETHLGSVCHETVQQIYKDLRLSRVPTLEETLAFYEDVWDKTRSPNMRIVRERYTEENYRQTGRKYVEDFYKSHHPFTDGRTIGIEKQVEIHIGEVMMTGYIDRLVDHGGGKLEIIDYKTSSDLPGLQDLENNWQLPLYHLGLKQMFPDLTEVTCTWHYLAHNKCLSLKRTDRDLEELKREVLALIARIEATAEFEPRTSALCSWCDYEIICPARKHFVALESLPKEELLKEDGFKLVEAYVRLKTTLADNEAALEQLEERIYRYADKNHLRALRGPNDRLTIWTKKGAAQMPGKEKDPRAVEAVTAILKKHGLWDRFSYLSSFQLSKAVDNGELPPAAAKELAPFITRQDVRRIYLSKLRGWE